MSTIRSKIGRLLGCYRRDKEGSVAVEFAMLAVPFFMLVFGIFETGQILWSTAQIEFHTSRIVRMAAVDADYSNGQAQSAIQAALDDLDPATLEIAVSRETGTGSAPDILVVQVDYLYVPVTPFLLRDGFQISHSSRFPLVGGE